MASSRPNYTRPLLHKSIIYSIALLHGSLPDMAKKNPHAVALGRLGGKKGGKARWTDVSVSERSAILRQAALARWKKVAPRKDKRAFDR